VNQLTLTATLVERQALRYTPAGVPVLGFTLAYAGEVMEAGAARQLGFELPALAIGDIALSAERIAIGQNIVWTGFLAPKKQGAKQIDFHVTAFESGTLQA